jgi:PST family polysaccharide transporter
LAATATQALRPTNTTGSLGITVAGQAWRFVISLASAIILGRLLTPADFGLLATLAPVVALAELIRDLGFSQAIVQRAEVTKAQSDGIFWISMMIAGLISLAMLSTSAIVAHYFHEPRLRGLLVAQSLSMLISSCAAQPFAFLNRQLKFTQIALTDTIGATIGLIISATGAWLTHSYWAIFVGGVAQTTINLVLASYFSRWRPGAPVLDRHVFDMVKFGANVSVANLFNFLSRNTDNLLIAKADGPVQLGLYDRSYKLMLLPLSQLTWPIARVLVPTLSRLSDDEERYRSVYFKAITLLMVAAQPGLILAAIFARPLVLGLLGPRWSGVPPIFIWLALAGIHQLVTGSFNWLFISQGRAKELAILSLFLSVTTILSFLIGLPGGPVGVAAAYAISDYLVRVPVSMWRVGRTGPVSFVALLSCIAPHIVACIGCAGALKALSLFLPAPNLLEIGISGAPAYGVYLLILFLFPKKLHMTLQEAARLLVFLKSGR